MSDSKNLPLYSDDTINITLSATPITKGHMIVSPADNKKKTLGELSDDECTMLFYGASYGATAIFEYLQAKGSNIILTEDNNTLRADVIARDEEDGLELMWKGKQSDPNELQETAKSIKDAVDYELWAYNNPEEAANIDKPKEPQPTETINADEAKKGEEGEEKVNYLLRGLNRTP